MNLIQRSQQLAQRITTDANGFGTAITFVAPDNSYTKTVTAVASKHMLKIDENGFKSIARTATLAVSEAALISAGYPTRNAKNEVALLHHKVSWTDVSGLTWTYTVRQNRPDDTIGLITLVLDNYDAPVTPERIIIGWAPGKIYVNLVTTPGPATQTLDNGDVIPLEYVINGDGTFTVPYLISVSGINVLTPFMLNNNSIAMQPYAGGIFTPDADTVFAVGNEIAFNAALPIWSV
jgi:hypothetical protein